MTDRVQLVNFTDITILDAILHIIDNKNNDKSELSDICLDIEDQKVGFFLKKHVMDSLRDDKITKAKFNTAQRNIVLESCKTIFTDRNSFISESKEITKHLFSFMVSRNISEGSLIVCRYKDNSDNICIALLKLDYNDYYIFERKVRDGKAFNDLISKPNGLPSIKQKLQKCAFIKEYDTDNEYDLLILDRQPNSTDEDIAKFFYKSFLDSTLCDNIRINTAAFFNKSQKYIIDTYSDEPVIAMQKLSILYSCLKSNNVFNANNFAELVFGEDEEKKNNYLQEVIIKNDLVIESPIDKGYVEKRLKKVQLVAAEGIEISIESHLLDNEEKFMFEESEEIPGTYNVTFKNIHIDAKGIRKKR